MKFIICQINICDCYKQLKGMSSNNRKSKIHIEYRKHSSAQFSHHAKTKSALFAHFKKFMFMQCLSFIYNSNKNLLDSIKQKWLFDNIEHACAWLSTFLFVLKFLLVNTLHELDHFILCLENFIKTITKPNENAFFLQAVKKKCNFSVESATYCSLNLQCFNFLSISLFTK